MLGRDIQQQFLQYSNDIYGPAQSVAVGASSTQSAAFAKSTTSIRVVSDVDCRLALGPNPTAVNSGGSASAFLPAKLPVVLRVNSGDKIATIVYAAAGTTGLLSICEAT